MPSSGSQSGRDMACRWDATTASSRAHTCRQSRSQYCGVHVEMISGRVNTHQAEHGGHVALLEERQLLHHGHHQGGEAVGEAPGAVHGGLGRAAVHAQTHQRDNLMMS